MWITNPRVCYSGRAMHFSYIYIVLVVLEVSLLFLDGETSIRWPEKGSAKESWLGPSYALQSFPHCSSTVLLRNQRACVGIGTHLGFHEGGTSTRHVTISRIRHVSVKCQAMATRVGMFLSRSPCFRCRTLKTFILYAFLFSFSLEMVQSPLPQLG